jgi:two-component system, NtrC family, nitrogen regulation sensor histidine kinase NtrY
VSLRAKFAVYLVFLHLILVGLAVALLAGRPAWLLAAEVYLVLSLAMGAVLFRHFWKPLDLVRTGAELIAERDFTCKFLPVDQPELDRLVQVYNRMIDQLREERLRVQEQHFFMDKILAVSPSGIITFDFDQRIVLANPGAERLLRLPAEQLVGRRMGEVDSVLAPALDRLETGEIRVIPWQGRRQVRCQKSHFLDQGFQRLFILMEELTEELRQVEKAAYEKIIRLLSHEVNNSAGAVISLLHSCLHYRDQLREEDREDFAAALRVAISRTGHLNTFMRGFADVIRLPSPRLQPVVPRALLEDIVGLMQAESQKRRIAWVWEVREAPGPIRMDREQMEQVFVNLLKNAMEAIGEDGRITIRMGKEGGKPYVVVEDTGRGIPPEIKEQLFTPFFSTKENGQGIGLTLVQEVLSRHGFGFSLESRPDRPTQFTIYF